MHAVAAAAGGDGDEDDGDDVAGAVVGTATVAAGCNDAVAFATVVVAVAEELGFGLRAAGYTLARRS